jgi:hypothetical protein
MKKINKVAGASRYQRGEAARYRTKYDYNSTPNKTDEDKKVFEKMKVLIHDNNPNKNVSQQLTNQDINRIRTWRVNPTWTARSNGGIVKVGRGIHKRAGAFILQRGRAAEYRQKYDYGNLEDPNNPLRDTYRQLTQIIKEPDEDDSTMDRNMYYNWIDTNLQPPRPSWRPWKKY